MLPGEKHDDTVVFAIDTDARRPSIMAVLGDGRAVPTVLLWLAMFCNLLVVVFVLSWLPVVMHRAGLDLRVAVLLAALFSLGGIAGSVIVGRLIDKIGSTPVLLAAATILAISLRSAAAAPQKVEQT